MGPQCRVAFALACSLRAASGAVSSEPLAETARRLAEGYAYSGSIDLPATERVLAELAQSAEVDRDEVAASYYALGAAVSDNLDSVVWSAQRAYEVRDAQAQQAIGISSYTPAVEERLLQCEEVQMELKCQAADLSALSGSVQAIPMVIGRAKDAASQVSHNK